MVEIKRREVPIKEEWQRHTLENVEKFLQALKQGFVLERYNEYNSQGKYLTLLSKGEEKVELNDEYAWGLSLMLSGNSEQSTSRIVQYLEDLKTEIGHKVKTLPDHLL
jgi:hypothetical protein